MKRLALLLCLPMWLAACPQTSPETPFTCGSPAGFACPRGTACELPAEGAAGFQGSCVATLENRCADAADCAPGYGCLRDESEGAGHCVPRSPCHNAAQCRRGELCVDWVGRAEQGWSRLSSGYCAPAQSQLATLGCAAEGSCPAPLSCVEGSCGLECGVASDCPQGLDCLSQQGGAGLCLAIR